MESPVVVVGLGGVGSHCAHALLRAAVPALRLVDFDRVSLSSLNRHAVALRRDVGMPKVTCCRKHFEAIREVKVDCRDAMFTASRAEELLLRGANGEEEVPKLVVDCIDDVKTKAELLSFCHAQNWPVVSALGSGAKDDPTQLCVAEALRDIDNDPLATKLRKILGTRLDFQQTSFVYSSQKVQRSLLPLSEEQLRCPEDYGNVSQFRLRVIPVLGSQPAAAGMAMACEVLNRLRRSYWARPSEAPRRSLVEKLLESFKKSELRRSGGRSSLVDVTAAEASFMVHEAWFGRSALRPELDAFAATGVRFTLTTWDASRPATAGNLILVSCAEAEAHGRPEDVEAATRQRVEERLAWARERLAAPLRVVEQVVEPTMLAVASGEALEAKRCELDVEELALVSEQLSRSSFFLGAKQQQVEKSFVVIVGLGAVGSSAAILLARAGVGKLRLIDGAQVRSPAQHGLAKAADLGRAKVDVCKEAILAVLPHLDVEVCCDFLRPGHEERLLGAPELLLDCLGDTRAKEPLLRYASARRLRCVSVSAPKVARADPSRVAVACLEEVWACPATVAMRNRMACEWQAAIEVVHSMEPGLWSRPGRDVAHRLQLGATAAAVALLRLSESGAPRPVECCGMNFWKKLRNGLERQKISLDLYGVGCVAEHLWRGRSALSGKALRYSEMALARWDVSKPDGLANLVLLTSEEAQEHQEMASSGSFLKSESHLRVQKILQSLQQHLDLAEVSVKGTESIPRPAPTPEAGDQVSSRPTTHSTKGFAGLVGDTKLVELQCLSASTGCRILGKAEFLSPGGCQKDRVARQIVKEASATLPEGGTIVEGTSGSTGISLCLAAAAMGYKVHVVMPDDQAQEKVELLRSLGATVETVRPASISSPEHYVNVARSRAEAIGGYFANQFENPANFRAHYDTTGPEVFRQCPELDAFVMSAGTGGTLSGVGRYLKEQREGIQVVLADVPGSSLYFKVQKGVLYALEQEERSVRRHRQDTICEGIGLDRLTSNFALGLQEHSGRPGVDYAVRVSDQEALDMAHHLRRHEGLFLGSSAAVNCVAAVKVARKLQRGCVLTVLCDSGQRHVTKFYNPSAWADYGLSKPLERDALDLSFVT